MRQVQKENGRRAIVAHLPSAREGPAFAV